MPRRVRVVTLVAVLSVLWGANFVALRFAAERSTPFVIGAVRCAVGGGVLLAVAARTGARLPRTRRDLGAVLLMSLSLTTLSSLFVTWGVELVPAGVGALLVNTMPIFLVLLSWMVLREVPRPRMVAGAVLGLFGLAVILVPDASGRPRPAGVLLLLAAAATWALGSVIARRWPLAHLDPVGVVGTQLAMSAVCLAPVALTEDFGETDPSAALGVVIAYLGIVGFGLGWMLWREILARGTVAHASAVAYLVPVVSVALGVLLLGEHVGAPEIAGGALVVTGVAVATRAAAAEADPVAEAAIARESSLYLQ